MMNSEKIVIGILFGIASGVILGVLVAPEKGSDTRKKIIQSRDSFVEELEKKFNNLVSRLSGASKGVVDELENLEVNSKRQKETLASLYPKVVS